VFDVIGAFTTVLFHAPLNINLAGVDPAVLSDAAHEWRKFMVPWTWWNHCAHLAPLVGAVLFLIGLLSR
jgi:uncharacterized membrane protein